MKARRITVFRRRLTVLLAVGCLLSPTWTTDAATRGRPNVVLIMTDNQGAWTLGCYGNEDIRTPHIDRMAKQGVRFTGAFSSSASCSPSRATWLTGLMPSQHGIHGDVPLPGGGAPSIARPESTDSGSPKYDDPLPGGDHGVGSPKHQAPKTPSLLAGIKTLPEILNTAGYHCGFIGQWNLGDNLHPAKGFDHWIALADEDAGKFYNARTFKNGKEHIEPGYLTDFWTEEALKFIQENGRTRKPFFLQLSYNGPHGLGEAMHQAAGNRHVTQYAHQELPSFPREDPHPWLRENRQYLNDIRAIRRYAAEISAIDDGVGAVLSTLQALSIHQNTLVIFTSDNGWAGGQNGLWGTGTHTRPLHAWDSGTQIPLIWWQPTRVAAGFLTRIPVSNYDFMTSLLHHLGMERRTWDSKSPGRDYSLIVQGGRTDWDEPTFFENENVRSIRTPDWKFIERFPDGPNELYYLKRDPEERHNILGLAFAARTQALLQERLHQFFHNYYHRNHDLWKGGKSKTPLLAPEAFKKN